MLVFNVLVSYPEDSPSTDGLPIIGSTIVALLDYKIETGSINLELLSCPWLLLLLFFESAINEYLG